MSIKKRMGIVIFAGIFGLFGLMTSGFLEAGDQIRITGSFYIENYNGNAKRYEELYIYRNGIITGDITIKVDDHFLIFSKNNGGQWVSNPAFRPYSVKKRVSLVIRQSGLNKPVLAEGMGLVGTPARLVSPSPGFIYDIRSKAGVVISWDGLADSFDFYIRDPRGKYVFTRKNLTGRRGRFVVPGKILTSLGKYTITMGQNYLNKIKFKGAVTPGSRIDQVLSQKFIFTAR